jgi:hypothetical protein
VPCMHGGVSDASPDPSPRLRDGCARATRRNRRRAPAGQPPVAVELPASCPSGATAAAVAAGACARCRLAAAGVACVCAGGAGAGARVFVRRGQAPHPAPPVVTSADVLLDAVGTASCCPLRPLPWQPPRRPLFGARLTLLWAWLHRDEDVPRDGSNSCRGHGQTRRAH